jgi:DNA-binding response OmpR family regulator
MEQEWQTHNDPQRLIVNGVVTQRLDPACRCRVLVVDDDDVVREQLIGLLKRAGYAVRGASSGSDAVRMLGTGHCQILLTDWQMPDMTGLDLCRRVRLEHRNGMMYVLMLTVRSRAQDMMVGLAAGADDYLIKGAPNKEILARLEVARRCTRGE